MNNQQHEPLRPRRTVYNQVQICQVEGVGVVDQQADLATVRARFTVRSKDLPRILGDGNDSMLMNISEISGASLSVSVDTKNLMNRTVQINLWGHKTEVDLARIQIYNLIRQGYDDSPAFLVMIHGYGHRHVMTVPIHEALYLLREHNIVTLEAHNFTWIDFDASKAWRAEAAVEMDIQILGECMRDVEATRDRIRMIVAQAAAPERRSCIARLWQCTQVTTTAVWTRLTLVWNWMTQRC